MRNSTNTLLLVIGTAMAVVGVIAANMIPPLFTEMFENFGMALPWLTRLFVQGGGFLWVLPLLVPVLSSFVRVRTPDDKRRGIVALLLGVAIGFALPMVCLFSMYVPIFQLGATVDV
jgi:type II secretory pathway component PulF